MNIIPDNNIIKCSNKNIKPNNIPKQLIETKKLKEKNKIYS